MASTNRASPETVELSRLLEKAPYKFDFFQAMRLIEAANPGMERVGCARRPSNEPVRLGQEPSLAFAPSMLASFTPGEKGKPDYLAGYFFGMFGPNGPLPLHLSEFARDRERLSHDATFRAFADIFHHRMMSLFYRASANVSPTVHMDRPESDQFAKYVGAIFGMGQDALRNRDQLEDHSKLYMAGRLSLQTKPSEGMQAMLEELFQVPMRVEEYVGEWMTLPRESHCMLGQSPQTGTLAMTATIGAKVWGGQHKFRIICGPISADEFRRFLPGGETLGKLCATVRNYVGDELDWELRILLKGKQVPSTRLGTLGQLGWTSWIGEQAADSMADDVVLHPLDLIRRQAKQNERIDRAA